MYHRVLASKPHDSQPGVVVLHLDCGHAVSQPARDQPARWAVCPYCQPIHPPAPVAQPACR
ncbi:MAG: hypothetical protein U0736_15065 [Gemmataceae bacterium]